MKGFRIAAVQMNAGLGRSEENLKVHEKYVAAAAEAGTQAANPATP